MARLQKRADGRYQRSITDKNGKRVYFYGTSERELNRKILEYQEEQERGRKFKDVDDEWWGETTSSLAYQTVRGYTSSYERALNEFHDHRINEIQPKDIQLFFKKMALQDYAQKTIANQRIVLNQIFNTAIVNGEIQYNPCSSVKVPRGCKKTVREAASASDEEKILQSNHEWIFPLFALLTGLRKGEILALTWDDIDFDNNTINVDKSIEYKGNIPCVKSPKTESGVRVVPLLQMLSNRLKKGERGYIFSEDGGKSPYRKKRYDLLWRDYCRDVGISCTAHQLRHSYATIAVEEDVNPKDLQNALGHADITTTMNVYAEARKKSVDKVAEKLNLRFNK
jgi:integrase